LEPGGSAICRVDVLDGSQGAEAGVRSEFRFWVMLSSMVVRERRRKSELEVRFG